jgi:hypothetical protein
MNTLTELLEQLSDTEKEVVHGILTEYIKAKTKHPQWPEDMLHAVAILNEESGELTRACLQNIYEGGSVVEVQKEAFQTGAMAIRFLSNKYTTFKKLKDSLI